MMKTHAWMLAAVAVVAACNKAQFGAPGSKKAGGAVLPKTGVFNPPQEPLDLSELEVNKDKVPGGPLGGKSEVLSKTIELDCDNSAGVIVDFGEPGTNPGKPDPEYMKLLGDPTQPDKGDEGPNIGIDGKPLPVPGKPGDGKPGDGKPGDGKPGGDKPLPGKPPEELPDENKVVATVKGKFCPTAQNKLTVLFVVDYSGSMGRHVPEKGQAEVPGNDPQINGSCGRLRAAQAILAKIGTLAKDTDQIRIGMVPFAGGIVTRKIIKTIDHKAFAQQVNKDNFCQYVVQDASFGYDPQNPGGIDGGGFLGIGGVDSSTNYTAAFTAAESMLASVYGRKLVYFISDGEPTSGGPDPVAAGAAAGERLRKTVDNLELNGLLLGNVGPQAQQVLELVTGSPDRVRRAENADQLAARILEFPDAAIDESTGAATLTVEPYRPKENLGLRSLARDGTAPVWSYETQPFVLLGKPGVETLNVVEVTAKGTDGTTHQAVVKIRYRQHP